MPIKKNSSSYVPLPGSKHQPLANSRLAGPIDTSEISSITVRTRPVAAMADIEKKVNAIYAQPLSKREYMTREELTRLNGANPADLDAIERYAQRFNLVVSHRSAAERNLVFTVKLADLLRAFTPHLQL